MFILSHETKIQSNLGSQTSATSNNLVLNQVRGKNVLAVEQNFGSRPNNPFMLT